MKNQLIKTLPLLAFAVLTNCTSGDDNKPGTDPKFMGYWQEDAVQKNATISTASVIPSNIDPCTNLTVVVDATTKQESIELNIQKISFRGELLDQLPVTLVNKGLDFEALGSVNTLGQITPSVKAVDLITKEVNSGLAQGAPAPAITLASEINYIDDNNLEIKQSVNATVLGKTSTSDESYRLARIPQTAFNVLRLRALECLTK